jgi:hypothetical protein
MLSHYRSDKSALDKSKEHISHNNHTQLNGDTLEAKKKDYDIPSTLNATNKPITLSSGKEDTREVHRTDEKSTSVTVVKPQKEPVSFGWKTKSVIYGTVSSSIGYLIYTYWRLVLTSLVALFFYEMWDLMSARRRKKNAKLSD